ncbi:MAG: HD-GYP domain-containing protein, partial [Aeoliella sp.]
SERVALFGRVLAEQLGYDQAACERLFLTGLLHDVGKIGVSDAVLKKKSRLTDEEFDEIKRHPDEGWEILQDLEQLRYVLPGVLYHHEQIDGSGYPDGLKGKEIPLDGRILAIVDAYDAMTSDRPYRDGMPAKRAQELLRAGAGTQWDADLVNAFFEALDKIERVRCNYDLRARPVRSGKCEEQGSLPAHA